MNDSTGMCPKCGSPLSEIVTTSTGKKLQRCSTGRWNPDTRTTEGCDYVKWITEEPQQLDEKCPKCGSPLVLATTRNGKKLKKCSTNRWDSVARAAVGCDYVEWLNNPTEQLSESCPQCGSPLILMTTKSGKKLKKCSTAGWDRENRVATGCSYVQWLS